MDMNDYILNKINEYFTRISSDAFDACLKDVGCDYCPTPIEYITHTLGIICERIKKENFIGKKFLDIGCGVGNVCGVAEQMGLVAEGIELNPVLYGIAKQIYSTLNFYNVDIRDFNNYYDYDIIYYYAPFCREELQKVLKTKVEDNMKLDAYVIVCGWKFESEKDDRFLKIFADETRHLRIWQKIKQ
jgi:SAM-dependent methyltransferase